MEKENPFKKIGYPPKEVPQELKKKVMDDVAAFKFFSEVTSLFSTNYSEVVTNFLKKRKKS